MSIQDKLDLDVTVFGQSIIRQATLRTFWDKLWGAWKVLNGEAGIILVRISPDQLTTKKRGGKMKYWWMFLVILCLAIGGIYYSIWQYNICRNQVCKGNNCFWYCMQHISN
jgi:hypothetical protein